MVSHLKCSKTGIIAIHLIRTVNAAKAVDAHWIGRCAARDRVSMNRKISALLLTILASTGCATQVHQPPKAMVTTLIGSTHSAVPGTSALISTNPAVLNVPMAPMRIAPVQIRECNADKTACVLGVPKVVAVVTFVEFGRDDAQAMLEIDWKVERDQTITTTDDENGSFQATGRSVSDGVPSISDSGHISKRVKLKYDSVGTLRLPHGLEFSICVGAPTAPDQRLGSECAGPKQVL